MERHGAAGRTGWALTGALIAPFVLNSAYLLATRGLIGGPWGTTDWVALGAAVAVGIAMIARLPLTVASKLVIGAVYLPAMAASLVIFSLGLICAVFGNCL